MAQVISFFTGFETGDASELAAGGTVQSAIVRTGGYALQGLTSQTAIFIPSATQIAMRFGFYATDTFSNSIIVRPRITSGGSVIMTLETTTAGNLTIKDAASMLGLTTVVGSTVLSAARWYWIDFVLDLAAGGVVKVWINGALEINTTHSTNATASAFTSIGLLGPATPHSYYFDDVRIDTGGVSPVGNGRCIARQGINSKATTPTYTAWTKNGLTTSGECWSETPFGTTNNCTDTLLNDAQTMVVDKFSVDPSRAVEGTQAISSAATINAVKVCAIAKISVTTSQAQAIRRRVSSTDTDALVTLTTSDAFYSTAIFTDTAANLDAYEIGMATNATGLGTRTVEDMWMMVDYTPATNTLAAGVGAFTLTGNALTLPVGRKAALASGSFALTGQALTFGNGHAFALGAGSFVLSGQALKLLVNHTFKTGVGSFTLAGEPVTGVRSVLAHLDAGAFIVTGEATSLLKVLSFSLDVGPFVFTGRGIAIAKNSVPFNLGSGAYLVNSVNGAGKTLWRISKFYPSITLPPVAPKSRLEEVRVSQPSLDNWRNG